MRNHVFCLIFVLVHICCTRSYRLFDEDSDEYVSDIRRREYDTFHNDEFQDDEFRGEAKKEIALTKQLGQLPQNGELFEEDIIMDDRLRSNVLGTYKRTSLDLDESIKWQNGVIVYAIDPSFADCARTLLVKGIKEYEKRTCITFKKRTDEEDYVLYTSEENVCSSNIGKVGGMQKIFIGHSCCVLGTVLHETMHALGFIHEHSRHDRDDYVNVMWANIKKDDINNFNKYSMDRTTDNDVAYNLASVMHYRNNAFTSNDKDTLSVIGEPELKIGQRIKFSIGDVKGINRYYGCKGKRSGDDIYEGLFKVYSGKLAEERKKDLRRKKEQSDLLRKIFNRKWLN